MMYSSADSSKSPALDIKQINRSHIYSLLRQTGAQSRRSIARLLDLSLPTVVQNLLQMQQEGLVRESGQQTNARGRHAKTYSIVSDARVAIGLDITKYRVSAVAVDLQGHIMKVIRQNIAFSYTDAYYMQVGSIVSRLMEEASLNPDQVLGVGISLPGLISGDGSSSYYCKVLGEDGISRQGFEKYIPFPVKLHHDVAAAAFAESWQDEANSSFFYVMLSYSIGGAVFLNGSVYAGENNRSGEIGHLQLVENGKLCYCGRRGCADPYCSSKPLVELTGGDLPAFFELLEQNDRNAIQIWDDYLHSLARMIHNLRMLFDCRIVLGGYVGEQIDPSISQIQDIVKDLNPFSDDSDYLTVCRVKNEASAVGAALHYIDCFVSSI